MSNSSGLEKHLTCHFLGRGARLGVAEVDALDLRATLHELLCLGDRLNTDQHAVFVGHTAVDGLDRMGHVLDDELASRRLAKLERGLPHGVVGDLVTDAEHAIGMRP